jgi:hypothetical protein
VHEVAIPVIQKGFSPTFYAVTVCAIGLFGILAKQLVPWKKVQAEADASLRADLMKMMAELRLEQAAERKQCDEAMALLRDQHSREVAELKGEIKGLRDQLLQLHVSTGTPIRFNAPEAEKARDRVAHMLEERHPPVVGGDMEGSL